MRLWAIEKHPRLTRGDTKLPMVIAVHGWSASMMGRAGKAVNDQLSYGVVFLGDCAQVSNLSGTKSRTSVCLAQHLLRYEFPKRLERGEYKEKTDARAALKEEPQGSDTCALWTRRIFYQSAHQETPLPLEVLPVSAG